MSDTGSDTRSGLGARLRAGRERLGLTQLQTAEKLHVDPKVVESLEAERYDALGAPVFVRGHLKRYAELIGEQINELLDLYTGSTKTALPDLTRMPKASHSTKPSQLAVPALVVLIGFVMIGVVWWIVQSVNKPGEPSAANGAREVSSTEQVEPEPVVDPSALANGAAGGPVANASTGAPTTTGGAGRTGVSGPAGANGAAGGASGAAAVAPPSADAAVATTDAAARSKPLEVTLRFSADSWVEVYDAKGEKLFYDIGSANSQRTISGTPPFRVTLANAPGVSLDVNGKPAAVPENAVREDQAEFVINRAGRIIRARPQGPGTPSAGAPSQGK